MKRTTRLPQWPALALVTATALLCNAAGAASLYVFGDSLSDSGNVAITLGSLGIAAPEPVTSNLFIPSQPYGQGTFSNGPVWVEHYADKLKTWEGAVPSLLDGGDFAWGGARTSYTPVNGFPLSATMQADQFQTRGARIWPDDLFIIAVGGNDVRDTATAVAMALAQNNPQTVPGIVGSAAQGYAAAIHAMVDDLQARRARHILVWNVPDLGLTPYARTAGPQVAGLLTSISGAFNGALAAALADEEDVEIFDLYGTLQDMVATPAAWGLINVTDASGIDGDAIEPATSLFWDGIHPTAAAHVLLAEAVLEAWNPMHLDRSHRHPRHGRAGQHGEVNHLPTGETPVH